MQSAEAAASNLDVTVVTPARLFLERLPFRYELIEALLFGSRSRGDHGPESDVDIAVVLKGARGDRYEAGRAFSDIAYDVVAETGVLIHALPLWEEDRQEPRLFGNPALLSAVEREGFKL